MTTETNRTQRLAQLLGPFLGLIAVIALFGVIAPSGFLSLYNFKTVATQTVIVGLGAIGMTFVIVSGGIDLSVGSLIALSSVVTALVIREGGEADPRLQVVHIIDGAQREIFPRN